ncbi:MAG: sulfatase-like hydrolase/transferase [Akkermansiaceae bacterium]|jgi:arylsulfatase A-like enzyme|nr:sulfatase-like hydrolase/transferase [Akkermansiaceae bacterium]
MKKFLVSLLSLLPLATAQANKSFVPKKIILIMADDIGLEGLGCYGGSDYKTPRLDQLAAEGIRFTHAYSQPLCSPTRLEIMTGKDNHRNWQYFGILPPEEKTFGHMMQSFGYRTCIAGKWQLQSYDPIDFPNAEKRRGTGMHPKDAGFHDYSLFHSLHTEDKGSRYANPTYLQNGTLHKEVDGKYGEDLSVEFLLNFLEKNKDEKAFVYYPMALPHWPVNPTPHSADWVDPSKRLAEDDKYFPDMVAYMDTIVGRVVDGVEKLGLREETLILFYSDNGTNKSVTSHLNGKLVKGGKASPIQSGIRVPLIANWPGQIKSAVNSELIDPSDFLPTLAELAGRKVPSTWHSDGITFAPQLNDKKGTPRGSAFFWYDPRPGWDKMAFTRSIFALDKNYKLFSDGRLFAIDGINYKEELLDPQKLSSNAKAAKSKLQKTITTMMQPPISPAAQTEVDAFGTPIK